MIIAKEKWYEYLEFFAAQKATAQLKSIRLAPVPDIASDSEITRSIYRDLSDFAEKILIPQCGEQYKNFQKAHPEISEAEALEAFHISILEAVYRALQTATFSKWQ